MTQRALKIFAVLLTLALGLAGCGSSSANHGAPTSTATTSPSPTASPTPQPACVQLVPGAAPFTGLSGVSGLTLPSGAYISSGSPSGGGAGQYKIMTYTVCFQGAESAINGFSGSTLAQLQSAGWSLDNLFPDPGNNAYLDYCSNSHNCVNTSGTPNPFTFIGFDNYASHTGGYTTFRLQVATIAAPSCVNDPQYYSGAPKYELYFDSSSANNSSSDPQNHFQMPPGTRVSTFLGGGTAGSFYAYFCSAGTQASVVNFLKQAMTNIGWVISGSSASGFNATIGNSPTYSITVDVQNPNNYYLRVFVPM